MEGDSIQEINEEKIKAEKVEVFCSKTNTNGICFVLNADDAFQLRTRYRIVGKQIGHLHKTNDTIPMYLLPEEAQLGFEKGWIQITYFEENSFDRSCLSEEVLEDLKKLKTIKSTTSPEERKFDTSDKYLVFKKLHSLGYYITDGTSFGGDFIVYPNDPERFHAEFIVNIKPWDQRFYPTNLISFGRLGVSVKKAPVLASVHPVTKDVEFITITWRGVT